LIRDGLASHPIVFAEIRICLSEFDTVFITSDEMYVETVDLRQVKNTVERSAFGYSGSFALRNIEKCRKVVNTGIVDVYCVTAA